MLTACYDKMHNRTSWRLLSAEVQRRGLLLSCCRDKVSGCMRGLSECSVKRDLCGAAEALRTDWRPGVRTLSAGCWRRCVASVPIARCSGMWRDAVPKSAGSGLRERRTLADTERPAAASSGGGPAAAGLPGRKRSSPLARRMPSGGVGCGADGICAPGAAAPSRDLVLRPRMRVLARRMLPGTARSCSADGFLTDGGAGGSGTARTMSRYDVDPPATCKTLHDFLAVP
jgi:hypothetical protein